MPLKVLVILKNYYANEQKLAVSANTRNTVCWHHFYNAVDLVNLLEREKLAGKTGAGYQFPIQCRYGIIHEYLHCRNHAGFFDISHMGQHLISVDFEIV